ncbi:alpha/beta hydrolase [Sphingomonas sp. SUN039]|uniref:alpha/beta hydrolase n=1 Tax=Sphingomonas sp. SUN039 TaxID=2937787 RepID=UPI0021649784|nr:alpha/beta hydrolase [Sphingomonas sp. SUN039]UVO54282.1 alpha/beta hydrolase [Sphingomonas sp. SUN039]
MTLIIDRRALIGAAAMAALIPVRALAQSSSSSLSLVHPDLRAIVPQIEAFSKNVPPLTRAGLAKARTGSNPLQRPPRTDVPYKKRVIAVGRGQPDVAIYIINSKPGTSRPAILHTHGGGYVLGSAESSVRGLQDLCAELDCIAVSVEYRLAPETTYKGSVEDNYAGLKWLHANAASLGADPKRIAVMGESAGGGHAALLAITARDRGEVPLCFQCLIYPMLDDRTGTSRKMPAHVGTLIWTPERNRFGWESFLGSSAGGTRVPAGGVPARVMDLKGLPPTWIGVGTLDLFADEDVDYAQRLNAVGVATELIVVPGAFHGFDGIAAGVPVGRWFNTAKHNALRRAFGIAVV